MSTNLLKMGKAAGYTKLLMGLPSSIVEKLLADGAILIGDRKNLTSDITFNDIRNAIAQLIPWRKGPFDFFGQRVDAEWDSEMKWNRVREFAQPLCGRLILDVGSGNGYFAWQMYLAGARAVVCLEPNLLSLAQFRLVKRLLKETPVEMLPLKSDRFSLKTGVFDTVFSMGVLYHSRKPKEHLKDLRKNLRLGGQIVLETLVNNSNKALMLVPSNRYAGMRNVWSIPSTRLVESWLIEAGFRNSRCVNLTSTTLLEQKTTKFMPYHSLIDFLDESNSARTVEGYERPIRGIFIATAE